MILSGLAKMAPKGRGSPTSPGEEEDTQSLIGRYAYIRRYFPDLFSADDYIARCETILSAFGITSDNAIALCNLCRDESCFALHEKLENAFGASFTMHGLGALLTLGVIGIKAGLSHSPQTAQGAQESFNNKRRMLSQPGKEQYIFFSFPHVAIDSNGNVGKISRPNRPADSSACGALSACLKEIKSDTPMEVDAEDGRHDPENPEYSMLRRRLFMQIRDEGIDPQALDLVELTKVAERAITTDLECMIDKAVDKTKANYAVFSGVEIHSWASGQQHAIPSVEFVSPGTSYIVIDGIRLNIDLNKVPGLSPRMLGASLGDENARIAKTAKTLIRETPRAHLMRRYGGESVPGEYVTSDSDQDVFGKPDWVQYATQVVLQSFSAPPKWRS